MIFVGSKHNQDSSEHNQDSEILPSDPANDSQEMVDVDKHPFGSSTEQGKNARELVLCVHETVASEDSKQGEDDHGDNINSNTDDKDENYEEESIKDLTKRIEEFIAKVKRELRDEC
ncbi:hypothetical protein DITRI_Ditri04bG0192400 [Diplodiscus trichospermus]